MLYWPLNSEHVVTDLSDRRIEEKLPLSLERRATLDICLGHVTLILSILLAY